MFQICLVALLAWSGLSPLAGPPDMRGLATWYDPCTAHISRADRERCSEETHKMANGAAYGADAPTVAVDVGLRDGWLDKRAAVLTECGRLLVVTVTDTGLLSAAGEFRMGIGGLGTMRWWPAHRTDVEWTGDEVLPVVADFPRDFFRESVCCRPDEVGSPETTVVMMWLIR